MPNWMLDVSDKTAQTTATKLNSSIFFINVYIAAAHCSHHGNVSWSGYFGLGLKNLAWFTSLSFRSLIFYHDW